MKGLDAAAAETLHGEGKIAEIAEKTGLSRSALYRYGLPVETTGLDIPMRKLAPIMKAAGDYKILHKIAADCGFLCMREPRVPINRREQDQLIGRLQKNAADAVVATIEFLEKPQTLNFRVATEVLDETARTAIGIRRMVMKRGQLELAL